MRDKYFDDFRVGERFRSRGATFTEAAIVDFAMRFDPQPIHIDAEVAAQGVFGGLIASGFHTLSQTFRLFYDQGILGMASLGSPGFDELRWLAPVRPGDTVHAEVEVLETRPSASKPDRGIVKLRYAAVNQRGETVMTFVGIQLVARRLSEED